MAVTGLRLLVPSTMKEEWRCALMEHLEQSVMWAKTNWMLKLLAVNLAMTQQISVRRLIHAWWPNIRRSDSNY